MVFRTPLCGLALLIALVVSAKLRSPRVGQVVLLVASYHDQTSVFALKPDCSCVVSKSVSATPVVKYQLSTSKVYPENQPTESAHRSCHLRSHG